MRNTMRWGIGLIAGGLLLQGAFAANVVGSGHASQATPAAAASGLPAAAPDRPPVLTRELIALIQEHKLVELRTIYNGPFAAALFFDPSTIEYYVTLLKDKNFWWISKTSVQSDAESLYSKMATQTIQLAAPSLEKIQLDARIALTQKKLTEAQQRQQQLAEQVSTQNRLVEEGTAAQAQLNAQAAELAQQRDALQRSLNAVNATIHSLQSETSRGPDITVSWPEGAASAPKERGTKPLPTRREPVSRRTVSPVEHKYSAPVR